MAKLAGVLGALIVIPVAMAFSFFNMFWRRKQFTHEWWMMGLALALIAVCVVLGMVFFVVFSPISQEVGQKAVDQGGVFLALKKSYEGAMTDLRDRLKEIDDAALKDVVEEVFLKVRVPKEYQKIHLSSFLAIQKILQATSVVSEKERKEVIGVIDTLLLSL